LPVEIKVVNGDGKLFGFGVDDQTSFVVLHEFQRATGIRTADDRFSGKHSLERNQPQVLVVRGENDCQASGIVGKQTIRADMSQEVDLAIEPKILYQFPATVRIGSITANDSADGRAHASHGAYE
jgi:hypothetical protein